MKKPTHGHHFLLLELIIALSLAGILITALLHFFATSVQIDRKIDQAREALYRYEQFNTRLQTILGNIAARNELPTSCTSSLYTLQEQTQSLIALFNNGVDPDPIFSGPIQAKIFLDQNHNLLLDLSPFEKTKQVPHRQELLFTGILSFQLQFLAKKDSLHPDPQAISINNSFEWRTNWPKNRWDIPSLIRLLVTTKEGVKSFAFSLPFFEPSIVYAPPEGTG